MDKTQKRDFLDNPITRTKITSANVSFKEALFGYLLGPILAFITNALFNAYLNKYMGTYYNWHEDTDFVLLSILLPIAGAIMVVVGNLIVGKLIDRTKTSQGKARPYMLAAIPLILLSVLLIFFADPSWDPKASIAMISVGYLLYYGFAFPLYYTSHASMVALSTRNASKRSLLGTFSNASSVAAVGLIASILVPMFLQPYLVPKAPAGEPIDPELIARGLMSWKIVVIVLCFTTALGIFCEYSFTRERITEENIKLNIKEEKVSTAKQLKAVIKEPFWWLILLYFFFWQLGGQIKNASLIYYTAEWAESWGMAKDGGTAMSLFGIIGGIPTFIGMVIAWPLANKFGKAKSMCVGLIISVIGGALSFINPADMSAIGGNLWFALAGLFLKGVGSIPAMYVSMGLMSDVLNHLEAKNKFRSDGITMAIYGSIMVGMVGLATGLSNILIASDVSNMGTITSFLYFGVELICYAVLVVLLFFLNVEKFNIEDHEIIRAYQKEKVLAEGGVWVEPEERLRLEQEEADRKAEESRISELKAKCEKKHLSFEAEEAKYQEKLAKRAAFMAKFKKVKNAEEPKLEDDLDVAANEKEAEEKSKEDKKEN